MLILVPLLSYSQEGTIRVKKNQNANDSTLIGIWNIVTDGSGAAIQEIMIFEGNGNWQQLSKATWSQRADSSDSRIPTMTTVLSGTWTLNRDKLVLNITKSGPMVQDPFIWRYKVVWKKKKMLLNVIGKDGGEYLKLKTVVLERSDFQTMPTAK